MNFPPFLVLIHTQINRYQRFQGERCVNECSTSHPLSAEMVELFRVEPFAMYALFGSEA